MPVFKKFIILLILLNYLNTSVFLPETEPLYLYNSDDIEIQDEINTLVEFVIDICMDTPDETPEDEDDDIPDNIKFGSSPNENEWNVAPKIAVPAFYSQDISSPLLTLYLSWVPNITLNIFSPPPESLS